MRYDLSRDHVERRGRFTARIRTKGISFAEALHRAWLIRQGRESQYHTRIEQKPRLRQVLPKPVNTWARMESSLGFEVLHGCKALFSTAA